MLLMVVDVENVLVDFHHTPTASEGECCERLLRELRSDFGDEVQRLTLMVIRIHLWDSPSNPKSVLRRRDYSYIAGARLNYGFRIKGSYRDKWARVGSSVPQLLMKAIAECLRSNFLGGAASSGP
jgi:hypothetical protein